jgi:hypothetical protein
MEADRLSEKVIPTVPGEAQRLTVLILSEVRFLSDALAEIVGRNQALSISGLAADIPQALNLTIGKRPDIVLLYAIFPGSTNVVSQLKNIATHVQVIVFAVAETKENVIAGDCDTTKENFLVGAVSFDDWKQTVKIDQFGPPGTNQHRAIVVNRVDLNLTRVHRSVTYGPGATAGYVCNHLGPQPTATDPTSLNPPVEEIDRVIDNAAGGRDLIACVAMDYSVAPGVNDDIPFTRFTIFDPSGELLPSVNLDGRGEKFVPGACTVCRGGNKYAGKFPEVGTGVADLEAHFLLFDVRNFEFHSSRTKLGHGLRHSR